MLTLAEAAAAVARAERMGRISSHAHTEALHRLHGLWGSVTIVPATESVVRFACDLARGYRLRGYDAVQCPSALAVSDEPEFVAASGDQALLAAWSEFGLRTINASGS